VSEGRKEWSGGVEEQASKQGIIIEREREGGRLCFCNEIGIVTYHSLLVVSSRLIVSDL
jgi:hypothetical protein